MNIPLAYVFATAVGLVDRRLFVPALLVGYWLTNIVGLVMLHVGGVEVISGESKPYGRRELGRDLLMSVGYTLLVIALVALGVLTYPAGLLP